MSLGGVDLNLLPALHALLTERNVTRAAERMSLGQSAMSATLSRLRKKFGDPLLVRDGRRYVLTTLAESLVLPVKEAVACVDAVLGERKPFAPSVDERSFTVMTSDYVALVLLHPLLVQLTREAPGVRMNVVQSAPDAHDRLRKGSVDLVIYPVDASSQFPGMASETLFEDRFVLVADRENPEIGDTVSLEQFAALRHLSLGDPVPCPIDGQLAALGIDRRVDVTVQTFVTAPLLLTGTSLVSVVQERLGRLVAEHARLRLLDPPVEFYPLIEAMYWNPSHSKDPAHRWLRGNIIKHATHL